MKLSFINNARLMLAVFFYFFGCNLSFAVNNTLSPPWYLLQKQLSATLNADPCVHVEDLTGAGLDMEIRITVCTNDKAHALAAFVNQRHEFGDKLAVTVVVYADFVPVDAPMPGTLEDATKLLSRALNGNNYFVKTGIGRSPTSVHSAYIVFKPAVIQYQSDDISDWYLNTNEVAANIFSDVLNLHPFTKGALQIFVTTEIVTVK